MPYNYNEYMKKYSKENLKTVSFKLHKKNDKDIIDYLAKQKNKSEIIKEIIRKQI